VVDVIALAVHNDCLEAECIDEELDQAAGVAGGSQGWPDVRWRCGVCHAHNCAPRRPSRPVAEDTGQYSRTEIEPCRPPTPSPWWGLVLERAAMGRILVVGGGLAGLVAAIECAERGASVEIHEATPALGGRARSFSRDRFVTNWGPHALYRGGAGSSWLERLAAAAGRRSWRRRSSGGRLGRGARIAQRGVLHHRCRSRRAGHHRQCDSPRGCWLSRGLLGWRSGSTGSWPRP
jgi:hypothetical protein